MATGREARLRIGTEDRERAVDALGAHLAAGRLDVDEYAARCTAANAARTRAELLAAFEDLPAPHPTFGAPLPGPVPGGAVAQAPRRDPLIHETNPHRTRVVVITGLSVALAAVVTVVAVTGTWWALAPILLVGIFVVMVS
ncbi:DUF1707 SHOCT-like domain-containing protein [Actinokineospora bangkokensis]|uniref:DUF1707 domain-containing protein n=1 Tax=Actinokineospora bangkokensis TaxID=1193682 RepID=A0A1Q9LH21_9PSEU|nr:DUF1707 domain-containing protein [Actinokineospora bangkokensis]OLR91310.1 hypothetical protein BJP25_26970 [Actinokineospora bangkokensis]